MARTSSDFHDRRKASDPRTVTRGAFQFPATAFSGKKHWPLDLKYRLWQWNTLLRQIIDMIGPELGSDRDPEVNGSANDRIIGYARHLYECKGSASIRLGDPIRSATRRRGGKKRTFLLVDSRKASPVWNYLRAGRRNRDSDLFRLLRSTPSRMAHLTLGHRHLLVADSDAETVHNELDYLKERLRRFRARMRPYIRGGYQTFEIERERLGPSAFRDQQVYIHAHMLVIPMAVPIHQSRQKFEQLVQRAWRLSRSPRRRGVESTQCSVTGTEDDPRTQQNWLEYLAGLQKPSWYNAKRPIPKILDGVHEPCLMDGSKPKGNTAFRRATQVWNRKGPLTAHQLFLILAGFVYRGRITTRFGCLHLRSGGRGWSKSENA